MSLLTDASTELVFPLLPLFLTTLGGGAILLGAMEGAAESVASLLKYGSGRLSDRLGRRRDLALVGYGLSAATKLGLPAAARAVDVVLLRIADRFGKGIRGAPRDALIADSVAPRRWGLAYGFHRALDTTGAFLGPLLGLALLPLLGLRELFAVAAVPAVAAVGLLAFVRDPPRAVPRPPAAPARAVDARTFSYLLTVAVFTLGNFGFLFLLLRATEVGLGLRGVLSIQLAYTAIYALLALPLGAVSDRVGRVPFIALAMAALAAGSLLMVELDPSTLAGFVPAAIAFGVSSAAFEGNGRALAADLAPAHARGTVLGAYHATIGFAALPAGLLGGLLWGVHRDATFLAGALFAGVALVELVWLWSRGTLGGAGPRRPSPPRP